MRLLQTSIRKIASNIPNSVYVKVRRFLYLGNNVTCPCCNWSFRKFLPFGVRLRPDALCPKCESVERHRLLLLYLKNRTNFFKDDLKVLDIAPMKFFQDLCKSLPNIDYTSADIESELAMMKFDIIAIPLPDNQFDCIICYHVFEHIVDDLKAMREIFRILKPGGWAILQSAVDPSREQTFEDSTVVSPDQRGQLFGQSDHVRVYGNDYKKRLEQASFVVKVDYYVQQLEESLIKRYGLNKNEGIYYCSKPE